MASRTAILCLTAAVAIAAPRAAAQFPSAAGGPPDVPAPDPSIGSPLLTPPGPFPRGEIQYPNLPPTTLPPGGATPYPGVPPLAAGPGGGDQYLSEGQAIQLPGLSQKGLVISPRYGNLGAINWYQIEPGLWQLVYTGGVIVTVSYTRPTPLGPEYIDFEFSTDNLVAWRRSEQPPENLAGEVVVDPTQPADKRTSIELFLKGNVVVRNKDSSPTAAAGGQFQMTSRTIRADQVYYDVDNNRAIALDADLEVAFGGMTDTAHVYGKEIQRLGLREWRGVTAGAFSSKLPSDPSVRLQASRLKFVERDERPTNIFGLPYRTLTGAPVGNERLVTAWNARISLLGVPVFYTPYYRADVTEPLGPLLGLGFGNDKVFGTQFYTTWDLYKLLALRAPAGHSWRLQVDELTDRGTAFGTVYAYNNPDFFGFAGPVNGEFRYYGLKDYGADILGLRTYVPDTRQDYRFRLRWQHLQQLYSEREPGTLLPTGWTVTTQNQFAWLSDKNFLEQYAFVDYLTGPNYETFSYTTATNGNYFGSLLFEGGERRDWITETRWLPRVDAAAIGKSFLDDRVIYSARANAGYAEFLPATTVPYPVLPTDQQGLSTGRFDVQQEASVPVQLGPVRVAPYGVLDLAEYTRDIYGNSVGRVYGGGGVRAGMTLSQVYPDAASELFNVRGLNHKVTFNANYFNAASNVPYTQLPQLDRLNDDQIDYAYRASVPFFPLFVPARQAAALQAAAALQGDPWFNPQQYAIRRLVDNRVDTLDTIQEVQLGVDQRLQTKRGFPGAEHTVDWMVLNTSITLFPAANRDNYGKGWSFFDYYYLWNIGDRTAITSAGWFDPYDPGTKYFNAGIYLSRPDRTNFYIGYRQTDPLNSKAVIGNIYYPLTKKYAINAFAAYDFGVGSAISNSLSIVRIGTDLTATLGFTYNAIVHNFGVQFSIIPNAVSGTAYGKVAGTPQFGGR